MPSYNYKAKTLSGELISGSMEAKDEKELAKIILEKKGHILTSIGGGKEKAGEIGKELFQGKLGKKQFSFKRGVSLVDKLMFTRHLGVMIGAGFPFDKSLTVLAGQSKNQKFQEIILQVHKDVTKGESFSNALKKHPKVFSHLYWSMVKVGEETGNLTEVLDILAEQMKKDHELISRVKGAMMYPAVILVAMLLIGSVMMVVIIPKFSELFEELNVDLPLTTQVIMSVGNFLAQNWYVMPLGVLLLVFLFRSVKKTTKGKRFLDWSSLKFPIMGSLTIKINTARTARILSSLLASGVPIVTTLEILSDTLPSSYYKEATSTALKEVQRGKSLHQSLSPFEKIYSFLLIQMLEVGEETGKLETVLESLAEFYELEIENTTKNLSSIIEPILMLVIGGAVGFFALSIFQPIYSIMGQM